MSRYKRYERYKDSGVEWIGEIPEHWNIYKVKHVLQGGKRGIKIGPFGSSLKLDELDDGNPYKVYGQENIINNDFTKGNRFINQEKFNEMCGYQLFAGDIIISMMGTIGRCKVVPLGIQPGIMDSHLIRLRTNNEVVIPEFLEHLIDSTYYVREQINFMSKGSIMSGLNSSIIKEITLAIPSIVEQEIITTFLDQKTAEIDGLIADKEKLIELLQEKRQAIISEAVTKGLNPNVKMKDSGIEWIGEIPEHWEVMNLGYRTKMIVPMRDKPTEFNGDIPWIRIEDVDGKYIEDSKSGQRVSEKLVKEMNLKVYPVGTVLCTCSCNMGTTVIVKRPLISNQTFIGIVPYKNLDSTFLYYIMNASSKRLQYLGEGAIQQYLSRHDFEHLKIAFPTKQEQKAIANFLDKKTAEIDDLVLKIKVQIERLKEYRQSLISEAVTGKIDVRDCNN